MPCAVSPPKHTIISPLPPPTLSPQTQQLVNHNPQWVGFLAGQLLQLINHGSNQLPAQPVMISSPSAVVGQETPVVQAEVKGDTLVIPASPPIDQAHTDNTEIISLCESPPMFSSPIKQPLTSTQINVNDEIKENGNLPGSHDVEASVRQEQEDTVVSLSSQDIVLPANLTGCDQTDSMMDITTNEGLPEQRHNLRKRNETQKMANFRHTMKRQHRIQLVMIIICINQSKCGIGKFC